ncbi:MAG: hypothetical protein WBA41_14675, partial [Rivularia sp. (in: cyanobacteria)]
GEGGEKYFNLALCYRCYTGKTPPGSTLCLCRGTLSAVAHGGDPQDRAASPPQVFHRLRGLHKLISPRRWTLPV